jgi:tetratricopeptide (TPR) repeat protein
MNFLLYMLGRASQNAPGLRPTPRQNLLARAAHAGASGQWQTALDAYRTLSATADATTLDILICGHLYLVREDEIEARLCFAQGLTRLYQADPATDDVPTAVERLLDEAAQHQAHGHAAETTLALRRARALLEVLMSAEAGLLLATHQPAAGSALEGLVHLSDLTLRLLARAQIAGHLAGSLRQRHMRDDLALWATTGENIQALLETECDRLALLSRQVPGHAEIEYRLGLTARAAGRMDHAAAAFRRVLALHPHHIPSAVRLALTGPDAGALHQAFHVPVSTMRLFADFAAVARTGRSFDEMTRRLCLPRTEIEKTAARGNLAFALSELALLDESRESWREPVPA